VIGINASEDFKARSRTPLIPAAKRLRDLLKERKK